MPSLKEISKEWKQEYLVEKEYKKLNRELKDYDCACRYHGDATSCGGCRTPTIKRMKKERRCKNIFCGAWLCERCSENYDNLIGKSCCNKCGQDFD